MVAPAKSDLATTRSGLIKSRSDQDPSRLKADPTVRHPIRLKVDLIKISRLDPTNSSQLDWQRPADP